MNAPARPVMRYHGGKARLAPWIVSFFPAHRTYVEPFGGAASVLMAKAPSYAEIYNELDGEIVNVFAVLRDEHMAACLQRLCELTPFAREEFERAYEPADDPVEQARRTLIRSWMGHGSSGLRGHKTGFRANPDREHSTAMDNWATWPPQIPAFTARLKRVAIENRDAFDFVDMHDKPGRLLYVDPPYVFATRSQKRVGNDLYHGYRHELTDDQHVALLDRLCQHRGMIVLSGYPSALYESRLEGWVRFEKEARADRGLARTEVVWINPACAAALAREGRTTHAQQLGLLGIGA
ncbi:DNA adenine methylase [Xanthobacteraceae bacterium Astr-EGSB]|uniref:DNA adenine methylase n=1 Tax=Astrobacterium formosum TaxID=3069710 RepID=UPI0027ADE875|nr:DNA adenine methylase [Xanthobacteraceae bacterium Astr-EGSB]